MVGGSRSQRVFVALTLLAGALVSGGVQAPPAQGFDTYGAWGSNAAHAPIARRALACQLAGQRSSSVNGYCFEPGSIDQVAGTGATFVGGVGISDMPTSPDLFNADAHCDDADYLDPKYLPAGQTYIHDRAAATAVLQRCVTFAQNRFNDAVNAAAGLVKPDGSVADGQADVTISGCTMPGDTRAKCRVLAEFGRLLHVVQDFYAHSNWADQPVPGPAGQPPAISINNPPGLHQSILFPAFADLANNATVTLDPAWNDLSTGWYKPQTIIQKSTAPDECPGVDGRITHACLTKDTGVIDPSTGLATNSGTVRGQAGRNFQEAVNLAIKESQRQWTNLKNAILAKYPATGEKMLRILTQDIPKIDVAFVIDTTGSMGGYINELIAVLNQFLDRLDANQAGQRVVDYQIAVVDFKDVDSCDTPESCQAPKPGDYDAVVDLGFSNIRADINAALGTLPGKVSGGGDIPEDQLSGIHAAVMLKGWRHGAQKLVMPMSDAAAHDPEKHSGLTMAKIQAEQKALDPAIDYPILVGSDPAAHDFSRALAAGSDGQVFDANASGVGDAVLAAIDAFVAAAPTAPGFGDGYWLVASDGGIFSFGDAAFHGSTGAIHLNQPIVGMAETPTGDGYWLVASDGGIFSFGDAAFHGSTGAIHLNQPIVAMAATPTGQGYWLVASDGGIFNFGDARFFGSTGGIHLSKPIVGMASTPTGAGYWLVASDGGIFNFGDAPFRGSASGLPLKSPIVGMARTPSGQGYWLVAADGGIFSGGDAAFQGSTGALRLNSPIIGMAPTVSGQGYWLLAGDGGIFSFGDARFKGSTGALVLNRPIVTMALHQLRI